MVKIERKNDFKFLINKTAEKWRPVERKLRSDIDSCF